MNEASSAASQRTVLLNILDLVYDGCMLQSLYVLKYLLVSVRRPQDCVKIVDQNVDCKFDLKKYAKVKIQQSIIACDKKDS
jgi:hypothetical protein